MGALEDLAVALLSDQVQGAVQADNPYKPYENLGESTSSLITGLATKSPGQFKTSDIILGGLLSGLGTGVASGLGEDRNARALDQFQGLTLKNAGLTNNVGETDLLSPGLNKKASSLGSMFAIRQNLGNKDEERKVALQTAGEIKKKIADSFLTNPRLAQKALPQMLAALDAVEGRSGGSNIGLEMPEASPAAPTAQKSALPNSLEGNVGNEILTLANQISDETGATPTAALETANKVFANKREEIGRQYKRLEESAKRAADLKAMADNAELAVQNAGYTGPGGGIAQAGSWLASFASDEQGKKFSATQDIDALKNAAIKLYGPDYKGAMSDREFTTMTQGGASKTKSPEANLAFINRLRYAAKLEEAYTDFMTDQREKGIPVSQAEKAWRQAKTENPFLLKDPSTGKLGLNAAWIKGNPITDPKKEDGDLPEAGLLSESNKQSFVPLEDPKEEKGLVDSAVSTVGEGIGKVVSGISKAPKGIAALFDSEAWKEMFATPETGARSIGSMAGMTAGATAGGTAGATLGMAGGPLGSLALGGVGTILGGAGGLLGFNSATEAALELTGQGTEKNIVPTKDEVMSALEAGGTAAATAGIFKVAGKGASALSKVPGKVVEGIENTSGKLKETALGVRPKDIAENLDAGKKLLADQAGAPLTKAFVDGEINIVDSTGKIRPATDIAEVKAAIQQSVKIAEKDGLKLQNDPAKIATQIEAKLIKGQNDIADLHAEAGGHIRTLWNRLSPIEKAGKPPIVRDPKTGIGGFQPDFRNVFEKINQIARTDAETAQTLRSRALQQIRIWDKSPRSYESLQQFKKDFGRASTWEAPSTEVANPWNQVKQEFYESFADRQAQAYELIMSKMAPEKVGALKDANLLFHTYKNLEPLVNIKTSKGQPGIKLGALGTSLPGSVASRYPATSSAVLDVLSGKGRGMFAAKQSVSKALLGGRLGQALSKLPADKAKALAPALLAILGANRDDTVSIEDIYPVIEPEKKKIADAVAMEQSPRQSLYDAVISQESGGKKEAVSDKGAIGLMQIMPATAQDIASELGIEKYNLKDPETNKLFGQYYLDKQLERFNGDAELALTAYHSGPERVAKLLEMTNGSKLADIIDYLGPVGQRYAKEVLGRIKEA